MQYSTLFLSALAATGALAVPTPQFGRDSSITVVLENQAIEVGSQTQFLDGMRQAKPPVGSNGPFATVELRLGPDVQKAGLRCQVLDKNNVPITVVRGENVDITFADGDKGLWTFQNGATEVSQIICDPAFVQGAKPATNAPATGVPATGNMGGDTSIRVQLSDGNLATQTAFNQAGLVVEKKEPVGSDGPFNTVSLTLGADVKNQALRCKILDNRGRAIKVQRGQNIDITFADGGAGPWKFLDPATSEVSKIICDPAFVKASA